MKCNHQSSAQAATTFSISRSTMFVLYLKTRFFELRLFGNDCSSLEAIRTKIHWLIEQWAWQVILKGITSRKSSLDFNLN